VRTFSCLAGLLFLASLLIATGRAVSTAAPPSAAEKQADDEALRKANLSPDDGPALVEYLKQRTISESDQGKIKELIKEFSADSFEERRAASRELEKFGPAAIAPLKAAERDSDPEVAYRATLTLKRLEEVPHTAVGAAAIRRVIQLKPPGAAGALIGYLPLAEGEIQSDQIRQALNELAAPGGKADPALVAALSDPSPIRRGAAYIALLEGGNSQERIRIPDAFPQVRDAVRKDTTADSRFRGLWSLVVMAREKEFIADLIATIPQLPRNRLRQVEELLLHVAGQHPMGGRFGNTPDALNKSRDAWTQWWAQKGGAVDLVKFPFVPKISGTTEIVERDNSFGQGRVVCLGPDMKEKWRLMKAGGVSDARLLPNGQLLVADLFNARVLEFNPITGDESNARQMQSQPISSIPLANGGQLIVCRGSVIEFDKMGTKVFDYPRQNQDIQAGARLPNGDTIVVVFQQQPNTPNCFRIDAKGKEVGKPIVLGPTQDAHVIDVVGEDHVVVCEQDKVAEYDLKTAKLTWKYDCDRPTSVQRLFNGNTLIASVSANRAIEVDPDGNIVWEYNAKDQLRVARIYHR
jgi:hypothetical protein